MISPLQASIPLTWPSQYSSHNTYTVRLVRIACPNNSCHGNLILPVWHVLQSISHRPGPVIGSQLLYLRETGLEQDVTHNPSG